MNQTEYMTFKQYRAKVMDIIRRKIGGEPNFKPDEMMLDNSWQKGHNPSVPAQGAIEYAIQEEKEKACESRSES